MYIFDSKILLSRLLTALTYILLYFYVYKNYLVPTFGYMGYEYARVSNSYYLFVISLSLLPIVFFNGINNLSSFISILIYLLTYVPMVITIIFFEDIPFDLKIGYQIILLFAMTAFFSIDKLFVPRKLKKLSPGISFKSFVIIVLILSLYLFVFYRQNMRFVNFFELDNDLYQVRSENSMISNQNILNRYLLPWTSKVLYPVLLVVFLIQRKYLNVVLVIISSWLIFTITAGKIDFFMPILIIGFYFVLKKNTEFIKKYFFPIFVGAVLLISLILFSNINNEIGYIFASLVFMRTISISGFLFATYVNFFQTHPNTNFAHVNIINSITNDYPYGNQDLGRVVFYGNMNGNANFWVMDGVAGGGIVGVILISILLFILLIFINRLKTLYDERILYLLFLPITMSLLNVSLFTTILSGGGLLLVMILCTLKLPLK